MNLFGKYHHHIIYSASVNVENRSLVPPTHTLRPKKNELMITRASTWSVRMVYDTDCLTGKYEPIFATLHSKNL